MPTHILPSEDEMWKIAKLRHSLDVGEISRKLGYPISLIRHVIDRELWYGTGKPARCPDCGGKVLNDARPCELCRVRNEKKGKTC